MRSRGLIFGAAVVLVANAMLLWSVLRNRSGVPVTTIELTERELWLQENLEGNAGLTLRLHWERAPRWQPPDPNPWFDATKLSELGFDCHIPPEDPAAESFYRGLPARPAWVALEGRDAAGSSHMAALDVARDPGTLRRRHADKPRLLIAAGLVRLIRDRVLDLKTGQPVGPPRLHGEISQLLIQEINLPLPYSRALDSVKRVPSALQLAKPDGRPRYTVTLAWGANYEPWVTGCRLLSPGETD